jgi:tetratricopeptide (TPR) repeat protein
VWPRALALVLCGVLVYANSLDGPFVLDDVPAIVDNPTIKASAVDALRPPRDTPVAGRPLVNLTFALNYAAGGLDVRGYHAVNVFVHVLAGLLLAGIVRRTLLLPALTPLFGSRATALSSAAAGVWLVHPLNTEVVNYITQRTEGLMAVLYLGTLYCAVRALERTAGLGWRGSAVVLCALGMASKESMVTAPVMVALYDRVFVFESLRQAVAHRGRLYGGLAATWLVLAGLMSTGPRSTVGFEIGTSAWTYLVNQAEIVGQYLWLAVWPRALVVDYGLPRALGVTDVLVPGACVIGLVLLTLVVLFRRPFAGFLGAWFFVTLAPTSSLVPIATEVGAERRMYLPLAGLGVLVVVGGYWVAARWWGAPGTPGAAVLPRGRRHRPVASPRSSKLPPVAASIVLAVVCGALAAATMARNAEYRDPLVLAETVVSRRPHGRAHFGLADELVKVGQHERALGELRLAVRDFPQAHFGLANELAAAGHVAEAMTHAREFIRLLPDSPVIVPARDLNGRLLANQGQLDAAAAEFGEILRLQPEHVGAAEALGDVRYGQGRFADAAAAYNIARRSLPGDPGLAGKIGRSLVAAGRAPDAIPFLQQAVAARPSDPALTEVLGDALAGTQRFGEAVEVFRTLVALVPDHPGARQRLERARQLVAGASGAN